MSLESELTAMVRQIIHNQLQHLQQLDDEMTGKNPEMRLVARPGKGPWPWTGPGPDPAFIHSAVALFVSGAAMKQVALSLPDGAAKRDLLSATQESIADWEDDYCGTPPRPLPSIALAGELAAFANSLGESTFAKLVLEEAAQIAQKGLGVATSAKAATAAAKR